MALLKQGKMTVLVGGDRQLFEDCLPILQQSGKKVLYMGAMGSATIAKVVSNMIAAVNVVTMTEAMLLGKRGGVDLKPFLMPLDLALEIRTRGRRKLLWYSMERTIQISPLGSTART